MYPILLPLHNALRWLVLIGLGVALYRAYRGYRSKSRFAKSDDLIRHGTATLIHVQFTVGFTLYFSSPLITYFWSDFRENVKTAELSFFALIHISLMILAVVTVTLGSALAKRRLSDQEKFKTILTWYLIALMIILVAVPWPFSPFVSRPYLRPF